MIRARTKAAIAGALVGLALFAVTSGSLFAAPPTPAANGVPTHEQMHRMMDAVHGEGTSQRMHEAMGPDGEQLMDQCVAMMGMMQNMHMQGMQGMMNSNAVSGMMNGMLGR